MNGLHQEVMVIAMDFVILFLCDAAANGSQGNGDS
jgi:hypothetical protein